MVWGEDSRKAGSENSMQNRLFFGQNGQKKPQKGPKIVCRIYHTMNTLIFMLFIQWHLFYRKAGKSVSRGVGGWGYPEKGHQKGEQTENRYERLSVLFEYGPRALFGFRRLSSS